MLESAFSPATIIIVVVLIAIVILAVRRVKKKGACECGSDCSGKEVGCSHCDAADKMVSDMNRAAKGD